MKVTIDLFSIGIKQPHKFRATSDSYILNILVNILIIYHENQYYIHWSRHLPISHSILPHTSDYILIAYTLILTTILCLNTFTISSFEWVLQCRFRSGTTSSPSPSHFLTSLVLLPNLTPTLETIYHPYHPISSVILQESTLSKYTNRVNLLQCLWPRAVQIAPQTLRLIMIMGM